MLDLILRIIIHLVKLIFFPCSSLYFFCLIYEHQIFTVTIQSCVATYFKSKFNGKCDQRNFFIKIIIYTEFRILTVTKKKQKKNIWLNSMKCSFIFLPGKFQ